MGDMLRRSNGGAHGTEVRVWDLPTRAFHWLLALLVCALFVTGKIGGEVMVWHARFGYAVASLLLFRLVWGAVGGHWSRFASFWPTYQRLDAFLRGTADRQFMVGHSPLGGVSVFAMLGFLTLQVLSGTFSEDKAEFAGPFAALVANSTVHLATGYHKNVGQLVLIALIGLHLSAIAFYFFKRGRNLVGPMWTGNQRLDFTAPHSRDDRWSRLLATLIFVACAVMVMWVVTTAGRSDT